MKRIVFYDIELSFLLRGLTHSVPKFSMSAAAGDLLEKYLDALPEDKIESKVWKEVKRELSSPSTDMSKIPILPDISQPALQKAYEELNRQNGAYITVFSPKLSAYFRYMQETIPAYSLSKEAAIAVRNALNERSKKTLKITEKLLEDTRQLNTAVQ